MEKQHFKNLNGTIFDWNISDRVVTEKKALEQIWTLVLDIFLENFGQKYKQLHLL